MAQDADESVMPLKAAGSYAITRMGVNVIDRTTGKTL
jgi:hypothetical protein